LIRARNRKSHINKLHVLGEKNVYIAQNPSMDAIDHEYFGIQKNPQALSVMPE
jgi:hypothetical protein